MFSHKQHTHSLARRKQWGLFILVFVIVLLSFVAPTPAAALPPGFQEYYVLGHEEHIYRMYASIWPLSLI